MDRKLRIGINGFGRIGRTAFRVNRLTDSFVVVAINDINDDLDSLAYLMKYDSIHGNSSDDIQVDENTIRVNGRPIRVFSEERIQDVPWNDLEVDVVVGCTGNRANVAAARKCLGPSVRKVVFSDSPSENIDFTLVLGVNEEAYEADKHDVIGCSICDVVGLAPAIKRIEAHYGIESGFVTTLHPMLAYQNLMDGMPRSQAFKDKPCTYLAMGRSSVGTLIPKNTSLVPALERVIPSLTGRLDGMSFRVPTEIVASATASLILMRDAETNEVREFLKAAARNPVMGYTEEPLISVDYKHSDCSCVVDGKWIEVMNKRHLRLVTWYDNEWGYSSRLIEGIDYVFSKGRK